MINRIKAWLCRRPKAKRIVVGVDYPDWTADDRAWLNEVFSDARGRKLTLLLYWRLQKEAFSTKERSLFDVGRAAGMSEVIGFLETQAERMNDDGE